LKFTALDGTDSLNARSSNRSRMRGAGKSVE
jgi:hypothetical protein